MVAQPIPRDGDLEKFESTLTDISKQLSFSFPRPVVVKILKDFSIFQCENCISYCGPALPQGITI